MGEEKSKVEEAAEKIHEEELKNIVGNVFPNGSWTQNEYEIGETMFIKGVKWYASQHNTEELNKKIKAQTEFIAGQVMQIESLLETNRKIKENTIDKVIEWCDEQIEKEEQSAWFGFEEIFEEMKQYLIINWHNQNK